MLNNFIGTQYRLADNWFNNIDINNYKDKQINYLEIGTFYGANILSVANTYGLHNDSRLYCIDPWEDYNDYPEYKNQQPIIYNSFINNIENSGVKDKIIINRGYSNLEIPKFQDEFFDIIYIDGNHEPEYVLEDAVLSFRKLKKNGIMIFDDYGWGGPDLTQKGKENKELAKKIVRNFNTEIENKIGKNKIDEFFKIVNDIILIAEEKNKLLKLG
jgi:predicted O-methyltransferase YrrM